MTYIQYWKKPDLRALSYIAQKVKHLLQWNDSFEDNLRIVKLCCITEDRHVSLKFASPFSHDSLERECKNQTKLILQVSVSGCYCKIRMAILLKREEWSSTAIVFDLSFSKYGIKSDFCPCANNENNNDGSSARNLWIAEILVISLGI